MVMVFPPQNNKAPHRFSSRCIADAQDYRKTSEKREQRQYLTQQPGGTPEKPCRESQQIQGRIFAQGEQTSLDNSKKVSSLWYID